MRYGQSNNINSFLLFNSEFLENKAMTLRDYLVEYLNKGINPGYYFECDFYALQANVPKNKALRHFLMEGYKKLLSPFALFHLYYYLKEVEQNKYGNSIEKIKVK